MGNDQMIRRLLCVMLIGVAMVGIATRFGGYGRRGGVQAASGPPPQLVGTWQNGNVSLIRYYDPSKGLQIDTTGSGMNYTIHADGSFIFAQTMQSKLANCTHTSCIYSEGTVSTASPTLTFQEKKRSYQWRDSCGTNGPKPQQRPPKTDSFTWRIETMGQASWLVLTTQDGEIRLKKG